MAQALYQIKSTIAARLEFDEDKMMAQRVAMVTISDYGARVMVQE